MEMVMNNNKDNDIDNLSEDDKNAFRNAMSEMFRLDLFDVTKITNWTVEFIEIFSADVGENTVSLEFVDFLKMIKIQNIINQKPIIKLENKYYLEILHQIWLMKILSLILKLLIILSQKQENKYQNSKMNYQEKIL